MAVFPLKFLVKMWVHGVTVSTFFFGRSKKRSHTRVSGLERIFYFCVFVVSCITILNESRFKVHTSIKHSFPRKIIEW